MAMVRKLGNRLTRTTSFGRENHVVNLIKNSKLKIACERESCVHFIDGKCSIKSIGKICYDVDKPAHFYRECSMFEAVETKEEIAQNKVIKTIELTISIGDILVFCLCILLTCLGIEYASSLF